jgi:hypothetical protein
MICVFCGPTLSKSVIKELCPSALILPPAEQSDIDFAVRQLGATAIGLIDGVHRQKLPVFHKEILQALDSGVRVFGGASMGALRAVECEPWGAEPIGLIADWYRDGTIEADDEVCLSHGDEATGWRPMSVPLVNIRATLRAAGIEFERSKEIIEAAQSLFYPDRTWRKIFELAEVREEEKREILTNQLDLKSADAQLLCAMLHKMPTRNEPEREIRNACKYYGDVFLKNDAKGFHRLHTMREHEIIDPQLLGVALMRWLALEYCNAVGITGNPDQMLPEEITKGMKPQDAARLRLEQSKLLQACNWMSSSLGHFGDVPAIAEFMRVSGLYHARKNQLAGGG